MTINNLKELQAIIKLCRKTGISAIEVDGVKLSLGTEPKKLKSEQSSEATTALTDEDMLYWSSAGLDNGKD